MSKKEAILENIEKILKLSEYNLKKNSFTKREDAGEKYLIEAKGEIDESLNEYKKKNQIYLEDELGDIFWDFLQALKIFEKEKYIDSVEKVFEHSYLKYKERLSIFEKTSEDFDEQIKKWNQIKEKQKKELLKKHSEKYN